MPIALSVAYAGSRSTDSLDSSASETFYFIPISMMSSSAGIECRLVGISPNKIVRDGDDLEHDSIQVDSSRILDANGWQPLDVNCSSSVVGFQPMYLRDPAQGSGPLVRSIRGLVSKLFYVPAVRTVSFAPHANELQLTQETLFTPTPVLKRLFYNQRMWSLLSSSISLLFQEVQGLEFHELGGNMAPHVHLVDGGIIPVDDTGFGLRNALHLLTMVCAAPPGSIIVIDEPEQGLNQSRQFDFAALLETIRDDLTLVLATQSESFCKGLAASSIYVVEPGSAVKGASSIVIPIELGKVEDRRRLAKAMGMDPMYLFDGGRILFVEGPSDRDVVSEWLELNLGPQADRLEVQVLGGTGKIFEEFAKPMFLNFRDRVFFFLDSDGDGDDMPMSSAIRSRVKWFDDNGIYNYVVMKRRELENYVGHEAIAQIIGVHPSRIGPAAGHERWHDLKKAVKACQGFYDERKITVSAYKSLQVERRRSLFGDENDEILRRIREFVAHS